jgi:hypothetical protein
MIGLAPALVATAASCGSPTETIQLFDGKDISNWTGFIPQIADNADGHVKPEDQFSVAGGTIVFAGATRGYLRTDGAYENFRLTLEWRWITHDAAGDLRSGVFLRMSRPDGFYPRNYQVEIASTKRGSESGDLWIMGYDRRSLITDAPLNRDSMLDNVAPGTAISSYGAKFRGYRLRRRDAEAPRGDWNRYDIVFDRGHLTVRLNGQLVNEARGAQVTAGAIGLQLEGSPIQFRNISLTPMAP